MDVRVRGWGWEWKDSGGAKVRVRGWGWEWKDSGGAKFRRFFTGSNHFTLNEISGPVCMHGHHILQSMDQPGKVANPARGQLNRKNEYFPVPVRA